MLDLQTLPLFLGAVLALLLVPGPDMLLISAQSIQRGARYGIACSVGVMLAGLLQTALVALGLGHVMETWPALATAIRWVGAAYLGYLGVKLLSAWAKAGQQPEGAASTRAGGELGLGSLVAIGAANNLLNPKALLFFALFLPQFTNPRARQPAAAAGHAGPAAQRHRVRVQPADVDRLRVAALAAHRFAAAAAAWQRRGRCAVRAAGVAVGLGKDSLIRAAAGR
jgi:threonine/homoserine/homoserine lactone efflux protein